MVNEQGNTKTEKYTLADIFALSAVAIILLFAFIEVSSILTSAPPIEVSRYGGILAIILTILSWIFLKKDEDWVSPFFATFLCLIVVILFFVIVHF